MEFVAHLAPLYGPCRFEKKRHVTVIKRIEMLQKFLNEYYTNDTNNTEVVLNDAIQYFKDDSERRHNELIQFLDEFVNSEEFKEYLKRKQKTRKETKYTQYSLQDLEDTEVEDKYPLTTQSIKMSVFKRYFDRYIKNKENIEIVKKQQKGIDMIKVKIAEFKMLHQYTKNKSLQKKEKQENKILEEFCESLKIDISTLNLKSQKKIRDTVVCYQKIKNSRNMKVKNNLMEIVKKLTEEYKRINEIDKTLNKTYLYKVKKDEKIIKDMEIVGEKIILKSREKHKIEVEPEKEEELPKEEEVKEPEIKITKKEKEKKDKKGGEKEKKGKDKSEKKDKKEKKSTDKKSKEDKKGKKDKTEKKKGDELIIPPIPKCNLRERLGPENYGKMLELLTDFNHFEDMLEDQYILAQKSSEEEIVYDDRNFFYQPTALIFKDFYCGKIYKRKLKILNTGIQFQKLRILGTAFTDPYDASFFKVEPLFGIKKLAVGCVLQLTVTFLPAIESKQIDGKIIFVAYNKQSTEYQKFFIKIQCVPSYSDFKIYPDDISFGQIPIWRANGFNSKTVKLKNNGTKPCVVIIKKMPNPLKSFDAVEYTPVKKKRDKFEEYMSNILEECLEMAYSYFGFDHYYIEVPAFEEIKLNIRFKNVDYVGSYFETYYVDVIETCENDSADCTGSQQICISAETTGNFIEVSPECLDFEVCIINNVYQLSCDIYNKSLLTQSVSLKFPSNLIDYIKTDVSNMYIPSLDKRTVWLKFVPRKSTLEVRNYFDKETSILEFPIYFCVVSKTYPDIPPLKVTVFAILTPQKCLEIIPKKRNVHKTPLETATLNLGKCSVFETVFADIELVNNTLAPQIYGFTNIPQCLSVTPGYGFGEIFPNEIKTLRILFSPDFADVRDRSTIEGSQMQNATHFKLNLETISFLGQYKMQVNVKRFKKTAELILKELRNKKYKELIHNIELCAYYIKINWFSQDSCEEGALRDKYDSRSALQEYDSKNKKPCTTQLWLEAKITVPLVEFSHQYVEFPDTPCGSYSTMQINLRTIKAEYFSKKNKTQTDFTALFKIHGGSDKFRIEPTCGALKKGESKKITLTVRPSPPDEIIRNIAEKFKYAEVYERKREEYELRKLEASKNGKKGKEKDKKKDKKEKKGKDKPEKGNKKGKVENKEQKEESEPKEPEIIVTEKELMLDYLDYYPAEMFHWRNLEPYFVKTEFMCTIEYESEQPREPETLYLNATCRVTRPDFITTNLKHQRMNFGQVVIGGKKSEPVIIQNIHRTFIEPKFGLLNPVGPFSLPFMRSTKLPPEYYLEVPITFKPNEERKVEEYFEINSGATVLPLILEGTGVAPNVEILPQYLVVRLGTKSNGIAQCQIEIKNKNDCELPITIEKVFEVKGQITKPFQDEEIETGKEKDKSDKKSKASTKPKKPEKFLKYTHELLELEEISLEHLFVKSDEVFYDTVNIEGDTVNLEPKSSKIVNIGFGRPEIISAKKQEELRKLQAGEKKKDKDKDKKAKDDKKGKGDKKDKGGKKDDKKGKDGKKDKGGKDSKKSSKKEEEKKEEVKKLAEEQIFHIAKYNIMLNRTFLKDFIFISAITG